MREFFRNLDIVKKMTLMIALIVAVFAGIMVNSIGMTTRMREQHRYVAYQLLGRGFLLTEMQMDLRAVDVSVLNSFNNPGWLAGAGTESIMELNRQIASLTADILELTEEYRDSISRDIFIADTVGAQTVAEVMAAMDRVVLHVNEIASHYQLPHGTFDPLVDGPFDQIGVTHTIPAISLLDGLRDINLTAAQNIIETLYRQQTRYLAFTQIAFFFTIALIFAILLPTRSKLEKQMAKIEENAQAIKDGNFNITMRSESRDELGRLSNIMADIVDVFSGMIAQVIKTAEDIGAGKLDSRLEEAAFQGEFRRACANVNMLAVKVMEAADAKAEAEYYDYIQFMMDTVPLSICFWNENYKLVGCNNAVLKILNLTDKAEFIGNLLEFSPPVQPNGQPSVQESKRHLQAAFKDGYARFNWTHVDKEGNLIPFDVHYHKGMFMGKTAVLSYALDLRDFHRAVKAAERSALAEENSQAKSRFLARMSHEIRTPISSVLGIAEIQLQNPSLPMPIEESFAKIYNSAQVLLGIINDILDLSKIESGKMEIIEADYESASLINDIVQLNLFRLGSKRLKFDVEIDAGIPVLMRGDELRIKQVVSNLLSNSFKYTEEGTVHLAIKFWENDGGAGLYFKVADTGCGMSEDDLARIFSEFSRFNESQHRHIEGIGLGMAIVDNLARLMGAKMKIESALGSGTTIELEIPQKRASAENLQADMIYNLKNFNLAGNFASKKMLFTPDPMPYGHVLVVDDVDANLFVAKGLLGFYSINVETVDSGQKAVDIVKAGGAFDIIFMDHMMPGMDGIEATRLIRNHGYKNPVVALTANALIGQAEHFMQNGFDGFISKPIDSTHLNAILNKFIRDRQPTEVVEAAQKAARKNMKQQEQERHKMRTFEASMREEFVKSQKNAAREIREAFAKGDAVSCRRFAHTLKGLARTIGENELGDIASKLESVFEKNETNGADALLDTLEASLAAVVAGIRAERGSSYEDSAGALNVDMAKILADLEPLLQDSNAQALELANQLKTMPQAAILVRQIEDYDFDGALVSLPVLKNIAA